MDFLLPCSHSSTQPILTQSRPHCSNLYSPGTCEMARKYKSPSKIKRNTARLIKHLINIINKKPELNSKNQNSLEIIPKRIPQLSKSVSVYTNYPDPCTFCKKQQCSYDFNHGLVFSVSAALEESLLASISSHKVAMDESLTETRNKKPPDDAGGSMVSTHK